MTTDHVGLLGTDKPNTVTIPTWILGQASALEVSVVVALQSHFPNIRPSLQRISEKAGMHRATVIRVLADLERKGWIQRMSRTDDHGRQLPNGYRLLIWPTDEQTAQAIGASQPKPPKPSKREGSQRATLGGVAESDTRKHWGLGVAESDGGGSHTATPGGRRERHEELQEQELQEQENQYPPLTPPTEPSPPLPPHGGECGSGESMPVESAADANRQPRTTTPLPPYAEPHRELLALWWRKRAAQHPGAPRELDAMSLKALAHANDCGVLEAFIRQAVETAPKSLGTGYRRKVAELMTPDATGFDAFRDAYMRVKNKATNHSISKAITAYGRVLSKGITPDQLISALRANVRAQHDQEQAHKWAPPLPEMARWLREEMWDAYLPRQGASGTPSGVSRTPSASTASEAPLDDPVAEAQRMLANRRHLTAA